jgi:predicted small metal-binding protein
MKLLMCKDFGLDCPAEFRGETVEDVLGQAKKHGVASHGQTQEQVDSPEVRRIAEEKAREV